MHGNLLHVEIYIFCAVGCDCLFRPVKKSVDLILYVFIWMNLKSLYCLFLNFTFFISIFYFLYICLSYIICQPRRVENGVLACIGHRRHKFKFLTNSSCKICCYGGVIFLGYGEQYYIISWCRDIMSCGLDWIGLGARSSTFCLSKNLAPYDPNERLSSRLVKLPNLINPKL